MVNKKGIFIALLIITTLLVINFYWHLRQSDVECESQSDCSFGFVCCGHPTDPRLGPDDLNYGTYSQCDPGFTEWGCPID